MPTSNQALRNLMRNKRKALSKKQQLAASKHLLTALNEKKYFTHAKHIACYQAFDGELNLNHVIDAIWANKQYCYLPVVSSDSSNLQFYSFTKESTLSSGVFKTHEPTLSDADKRNPFPVQSLDLVLMPLVAFDQEGNRLGMGGGYYDASFQHLKKLSERTTKLVGVAHQCQKANAFQVEKWDVKPDEIIVV